METIEKVISIIHANTENCMDISPDVDFIVELGIDSLDTIMIINAIEDEFSIEFESADFVHIKTVNDIVKILENKYVKTKESHVL